MFRWVLELLAEKGLLKGETIGIDATTLEADAAMRSIVRRETGEGYEEFLRRLAEESGIATPTREQLAKLDRKRAKKGSNEDWVNPHDPEAGITKMRDHEDEGWAHASGLQGRTRGGSGDRRGGGGDGGRRRCGRSGDDSGDLAAGGRAHRRGCVCDQHEEVGERVQAEGPREAVTDKGYHSNDTLQALAEAEVRTYISEPDRGRRRWRDKLEAQQAVYGNRRRICGERGKELLGVGNCWNGASRTPMKREGCGECSCEGEKMFSSEG